MNIFGWKPFEENSSQSRRDNTNNNNNSTDEFHDESSLPQAKLLPYNAVVDSGDVVVATTVLPGGQTLVGGDTAAGQQAVLGVPERYASNVKLNDPARDEYLLRLAQEKGKSVAEEEKRDARQGTRAAPTLQYFQKRQIVEANAQARTTNRAEERQQRQTTKTIPVEASLPPTAPAPAAYPGTFGKEYEVQTYQVGNYETQEYQVSEYKSVYES